MGKIKVYVYMAFVLATLVGSMVCLGIQGVWQFMAADALLLAFVALDFFKVLRLPIVTEMHDRLFVFGTYIMVVLFATIGSIGYLFYYSYTVWGILMAGLMIILLLAFVRSINLPTIDSLK